jgi:hypothetical protein
MRRSYVDIEFLPNAHKGRWDRQICGRLTFAHVRDELGNISPWPVTHARAKETVRVLVHAFDREEHEQGKWYDTYLVLKQESESVWYFEILQPWLD